MNDIMVTVEAPMKERMGPKFGNSSAIPMTRIPISDRMMTLLTPNAKENFYITFILVGKKKVTCTYQEV